MSKGSLLIEVGAGELIDKITILKIKAVRMTDTAKLKNVGETVTMMPPTIVLIVQDVSELELRAKLPERALSFLNVGTNVHVRFPAVDLDLSVPIRRINPTVDPRTRTVEVVAMLDNASGKLKPGMLAEITIEPKGKAPPAESAKTAQGSP